MPGNWTAYEKCTCNWEEWPRYNELLYYSRLNITGVIILRSKPENGSLIRSVITTSFVDNSVIVEEMVIFMQFFGIVPKRPAD